jgi:hypothetical protein
MSEPLPTNPNSMGGGVFAVILSSLCGGCIFDPALEYLEGFIKLTEDHFKIRDGASIFPTASLGAFILSLLVAVLVWVACKCWEKRIERPAIGWVPAVILAAYGIVPGVIAGAVCLQVFRDQLPSFAIPGMVCFAVTLSIAEAILRWRPPRDRQHQKEVKPNIATYPFDD